MIYKAEIKDTDIVFQIASDTISVVYPHYYPKGVVNFFLNHHCIGNIAEDIKKQCVYLLKTSEGVTGTITIKANSINRLFVLPEYQGRGYGRQLMDFAEKEIAGNYKSVHIDSSLPAKEMYLKHGYREVKTCHIDTDYKDVLVYDEMEKLL